MLSKNKIKFINSLNIKKYRKKEKAFVCEGRKIFELVANSNYKIIEVFATASFIDNYSEKYPNIIFSEIKENELSKISYLSTAQQVLTIVEIPDNKLNFENIKQNLTLFLDKIQNPGNLGTIIRIADWFGIKNIVCTSDSVDIYNPKVIQATMGSFLSVNVFYEDTETFFAKIKQMQLPVYGTFIDGADIYSSEILPSGIIVFGNEANGITPEVEKHITKKISIPDYNTNKSAESLNIAVSAAIVCAEIKRRIK